MKLATITLVGLLWGSGNIDLPPASDQETFTIAPHTKVPTKSMLKGDPLSVILDVKSSENLRADHLNITPYIREKVGSELNKHGIHIKEQSLSSAVKEALRDEGQLWSDGDYNDYTEYEGPKIARYLINIGVTESANDHELKKPSKLKLQKHSRCHHTLKGAVKVDLEILPARRNLKRFIVEEELEYEYKSSQDCSLKNAKSKNEFSKHRKDVVEELVSCAGKELKQFLRPRAYVTNQFIDSEKGWAYYELSGGTRIGFDKGTKVIIEQANANGEFDELLKAKIIDAQPFKSYILVKKNARSVKRFDRATLYSTGIIDSTKKTSTSFFCGPNVTVH